MSEVLYCSHLYFLQTIVLFFVCFFTNMLVFFLYMLKKMQSFCNMSQTFSPASLSSFNLGSVTFFSPCRKLSHANKFSGPFQLVLPLICLQSCHSAFIHVIVCYDSLTGTFIQSSFLIFLANLPFSAYILLPNNNSKLIVTVIVVVVVPLLCHVRLFAAT